MKDKKDKTEVDVSFVDKQPPYLSVEDPGFPQGGAPTFWEEGGANIQFSQIFP